MHYAWRYRSHVNIIKNWRAHCPSQTQWDKVTIRRSVKLTWTISAGNQKLVDTLSELMHHSWAGSWMIHVTIIAFRMNISFPASPNRRQLCSEENRKTFLRLPKINNMLYSGSPTINTSTQLLRTQTQNGKWTKINAPARHRRLILWWNFVFLVRQLAPYCQRAAVRGLLQEISFHVPTAKCWGISTADVSAQIW
jgi:hypothetical protein